MKMFPNALKKIKVVGGKGVDKTIQKVCNPLLKVLDYWTTLYDCGSTW